MSRLIKIKKVNHRGVYSKDTVVTIPCKGGRM